MRIRTLAARLFFLSAIWAILSIALIAFLVSENYRRNAETGLAARLTANLYNIMGSVTTNEDGQLGGRPDLRDARFSQFRSGYYWSVNEVAKPDNRVASTSLAGDTISVPRARGFDESFQRQFVTVDEAGNRLIGIEAQAFLGEGDDLFSFKITGNSSEVEAEVADFIRQLLIMLTLFAVGFILVTFFIVRLGLAPLSRATRRLADIREGRAERLEGNFPLEIQPLIDETNSLIRANNSVIERARTQVGNLAHSLKTPLAVLRNEGRGASEKTRRIIEEQVRQMQGQIQSYLDRARIAARVGTVTSRTDIQPVLERLVRVMTKLNPHLDIRVDTTAAPDAVFAGEQQDLEEMVGNLLENACKFAAKRIDIVVGAPAPGRSLISIEDDGPGLDKPAREKAMQRGARLDETKPGSGLGLSIVGDIAKEYGGALRLSRSSLGGLAAAVELPSPSA